MHAHRFVLLAVGAALALPAGAGAQTPTPGPTGPTGPVATPAPAPAAAGKLAIRAKAPLRYKGRALALRGAHVRVRGILAPALAGQRVRIRVKRGKHVLRTRRVRTAADGSFTAKVRLRKAGRLVIRAVHKRSSAIKAATSKRVRIRTFRARLGPGSDGALIRLFQARLNRLGYRASRGGHYDDATARAVLAYRKVNRLARVTTTSARIIRRVLAGKGGWRVRHPHAGHHVEADLSLQALALIDGDKVVRVEPTSSGKPSTPTVLGHYRFYSKTPGTNGEGMVDSNYFIRGYAIHGYASVPTYNASHGCLRIPIPDAAAVYAWIRLGDEIFVEN